MVIEEAAQKLLETNRKIYPCHVNRIGQIDDPCLRRLYYYRAAWDKAAPISADLLGIFATGTILEPVITRIASEIGEFAEPPFRIVGAQMPTRDKLFDKYQISGRIDGFLQTKANGRWETKGVIDIKTCSPNIFDTLYNYESLVRYPWTRKWRGQLMLYALAHNVDKCFILLVNKSNLYNMRMIEFPLDYEYAEGLLKKAEQVNDAVQTQTPPEKLNNAEECPRCPFVTLCCPSYETGGNLQISEDNELEGILERLEQLGEIRNEIVGLEKARDNKLQNGQDLSIGRFLITWKKITSNYSAQPTKQVEIWRKKIVCTKK